MVLRPASKLKRPAEEHSINDLEILARLVGREDAQQAFADFLQLDQNQTGGDYKLFLDQDSVEEYKR